MNKSPKQKITREGVILIAKTYGRTMGATDLAGKLGVSKQRVQQVAYRLKKNGI